MEYNKSNLLAGFRRHAMVLTLFNFLMMPFSATLRWPGLLSRLLSNAIEPQGYISGPMLSLSALIGLYGVPNCFNNRRL